MTKKLEDLFNLESNQDTPESLNDKIEKEQIPKTMLKQMQLFKRSST